MIEEIDKTQLHLGDKLAQINCSTEMYCCGFVSALHASFGLKIVCVELTEKMWKIKGYVKTKTAWRNCYFLLFSTSSLF